MGGLGLLTTLQVHVATIFFGLKASGGYVVAGGAALLASELIDRATRDVDLFASAPVTSVEPAKDSLVRALRQRECVVELVHDGPTFCRLLVRDRGEQVLVDLAIDSPPITPPTMTVLGPTLTPLELAGRKLLALFGRAEARDFADVYVLVRRFGKDALISQAAAVDAGFDVRMLAHMIRTLDRLADEEIPLPRDSITSVRQFFTVWADELA